MPTKKARLQVTLSPEARAALERFSQVSGVASSQFITKMVDDALPLIESMTRAFETAKKAPQQAADIMREATHTAMARAAQETLAFDAHVKRRRLRKRPTKQS